MGVNPLNQTLAKPLGSQVEAALGAAGVEIGMMLTEVNGDDVIDAHYSEVMSKLKAASRPLAVRFNRVETIEAWWYDKTETEYQVRHTSTLWQRAANTTSTTTGPATTK